MVESHFNPLSSLYKPSLALTDRCHTSEKHHVVWLLGYRLALGEWSGISGPNAAQRDRRRITLREVLLRRFISLLLVIRSSSKMWISVVLKWTWGLRNWLKSSSGLAVSLVFRPQQGKKMEAVFYDLVLLLLRCQFEQDSYYWGSSEFSQL